jgi:nucleoside 2-deoxyribosyltransferase
MIRIYFASDLRHGAKWRKLCAQSTMFIAFARWLKHDAVGTADNDKHEAEHFWQQDEQDVRDADVLICYAEGDDVLRGALVEVGMAISNAVPVIVVGKHKSYGTWQYHPSVMIATDLDEALVMAQNFATGYENIRRRKPVPYYSGKRYT